MVTRLSLSQPSTVISVQGEDPLGSPTLQQTSPAVGYFIHPCSPAREQGSQAWCTRTDALPQSHTPALLSSHLDPCVASTQRSFLCPSLFWVVERLWDGNSSGQWLGSESLGRPSVMVRLWLRPLTEGSLTLSRLTSLKEHAGSLRPFPETEIRNSAI